MAALGREATSELADIESQRHKTKIPEACGHGRMEQNYHLIIAAVFSDFSFTGHITYGRIVALMSNQIHLEQQSSFVKR